MRAFKCLLGLAVTIFLFPVMLHGEETFTGADTEDNFFSNPANWDGGVLPGDEDDMIFQAGSTSEANPAIVDSNWNSMSNGHIQVWHDAGAGATYLTVADGGVLAQDRLRIGWSNTSFATRPGTLHLQTGGSIIGTSETRSMTIAPGASTGTLILDHGATMQYAGLAMNEPGIIQYNFGEDSVTTFEIGSAATVYVDGLIRVNLGALETQGTYTLMSSEDESIGGHLGNWLSGLAGNEFSGSGNGVFGDGDNDLFETTSADGWEWTLSSTDEGRTLQFTAIPEPTTAGLFVVAAATVGLFARRRRVS